MKLEPEGEISIVYNSMSFHPFTIATFTTHLFVIRRFFRNCLLPLPHGETTQDKQSIACTFCKLKEKNTLLTNRQQIEEKQGNKETITRDYRIMHIHLGQCLRVKPHCLYYCLKALPKSLYPNIACLW